MKAPGKALASALQITASALIGLAAGVAYYLGYLADGLR